MGVESKNSVVIVQYAGDFAEAYRRLENGGAENYYAQKYSLDVVGGLLTPETAVTVICCTSERNEDVFLSNGVRVINLHSPAGVDQRRVWAAVSQCEPTHVCLRTPLPFVLREALRAPKIRSVLLTLADSFEGKGLRARLSAWRLRRLLNHQKVVAVGNHGVNASESLRRIGVLAAKIIPWDWPHTVTPHQSPPKRAPNASQWVIFFCGLLVESKGIGDVIRAVRLLKDKGVSVRLVCAGKGETGVFAALASELGVSAQVELLGMLPHSRIVPSMKSADLIVIPSRHDYPEGFPMTVYEALSSRTPIVASDHPMYAPHLRETGAAAIFAASDPAALAQTIEALMANSAMYASLSEASANAWDKLQLPVAWGDLLAAWMNRMPGTPYLPLEHALSSSR